MHCTYSHIDLDERRKIVSLMLNAMKVHQV